jgi:hypothetical protein
MQAMTGLSGLNGLVHPHGSSGVGFQDTFNRPDQEGLGTSSDGTRTWVIDPPLETDYSPPAALGWEVRNERAGINFLIGSLQSAYVTGLGTAGRAKITLGAYPVSAFPFYILGRVQDRNNHLRVEFQNLAPTSVVVQKVVGGTVTPIASLGTVVPIAGDTLELEISSDDQVRVYHNGVPVGSTVNDSTHSSHDGWGMGVYGAGGELTMWDGSIDQFEFTPE